MLSQKILNKLQPNNSQVEEITRAIKKVKGMSKLQLEELKTTGTTIEKNHAVFELRVRESDECISLLMKVAVKNAANEAFEEALHNAGYKLVGYIEKIKR